MDDGLVLFILVIIMILFLIFTGTMAIIDSVGREALETIYIQCEITHMDIDNGKYHISVVVDNFSMTIQVSSEIYASYSVGDTCTVVKYGYYYPTRGEEWKYKIE